MGVVVYSSVKTLLTNKRLTLTDLERGIKERYGVVIRRGALIHLMQATSIQRVDIQVAGAVARFLEVPLGSLFDVRVNEDAPQTDAREVTGEAYLNRGNEYSLIRLFQRQDQGNITGKERRRLETLVAKQAQLRNTDLLQRIASDDGQNIDAVRVEIEADVEKAVRTWHEFQGNRDKQSAALELAKKLWEEQLS